MESWSVVWCVTRKPIRIQHWTCSALGLSLLKSLVEYKISSLVKGAEFLFLQNLVTKSRMLLRSHDIPKVNCKSLSPLANENSFNAAFTAAVVARWQKMEVAGEIAKVKYLFYIANSWLGSRWHESNAPSLTFETVGPGNHAASVLVAIRGQEEWGLHGNIDWGE